MAASLSTRRRPAASNGRASVVSERAPHGQAIGTRGHGLGIGASFQLAFDGADATHLFLELLLDMPIRFEDEVPGLAQIVELAQLVRYIGQGTGYGFAYGPLAIGDNAHHWYRQHLQD